MSSLIAACVAANLFWSPSFGCLTDEGVRALHEFAGRSWTATCGADGKQWPARANGNCYMADKPQNAMER